MIFDFMVNILEIKVHMYSFFMSDFSLAFFSTFFLSYISDYTYYLFYIYGNQFLNTTHMFEYFVEICLHLTLHKFEV